MESKGNMKDTETPASSSSVGVEKKRSKVSEGGFRRAEGDRWPSAEMEAHFNGMPAAYLNSVAAADLDLHLEALRTFEARCVAIGNAGAQQVVHWVAFDRGRATRIVFVARDRRGLLGLIASALSGAGLNILGAEAYTRADGIALDWVDVIGVAGGPDVQQRRLREMGFLLEGMVEDPPRFASHWALVKHKLIDPPDGQLPRITFEEGEDGTTFVMKLEAKDRLGLLQDLLMAVAEGGWNVERASIETRSGIACDIFVLRAPPGREEGAAGRLEDLREGLRRSMQTGD